MKGYKLILNNILFLLMLAVVVVSCEEKDAGELVNTQLTSVSKVFFDPANGGSVNEAQNVSQSADGTSTIISDNSIEVGVVRSGTDFSSEVTVSFTTVATYKNTTDFFDSGDDASGTITLSSEGSVTIPAGESRGTFTIVIANDELATGDKDITITLTETSSGELGLSEAVPATTQSITVVEDDCPFDREQLTGDFTVTIDFLLSCPGFCGIEGEASVTQSDTDPLQFFINDLWDVFGETGSLPIKLVTCSKTGIYADGAVFSDDGAGSVGTLVQSCCQGNWDALELPIDTSDPTSFVSYDDEKGKWIIYGVWANNGVLSNLMKFELTKVDEE